MEIMIESIGKLVNEFSKLPGVGKKTAEKICVELRDKVGPFAMRGKAGESASPPVVADAVAAL